MIRTQSEVGTDQPAAAASSIPSKGPAFLPVAARDMGVGIELPIGGQLPQRGPRTGGCGCHRISASPLHS
jgi:hypothetical protein